MRFIAADIEKPSTTVFSYLLYHGGIEPRTRARRAGALSFDEQETISRSLARGDSMRAIARDLDRAPSSISREVSRNGGVGRYRAALAEKVFPKRAKRPKPMLLTENTRLRDTVCRPLEEDWSPEQISARLKASQAADGSNMYVFHETIYKSLFVRAKGVIREELKKRLRTKRMFRHARTHRVSTRGQIVDAISIRERPAEVEDRAIPGHWKGDLIIRANNTAIATVVERQSRITVLCKLQNRRASSVVGALTDQMLQLPQHLLKSLTWNRGHEMSAHKIFTFNTEMTVYFCDPSSPWQRGTSESTNGLLRDYFPKGKPMGMYSQSQLTEIANKLNPRPRKTLKFKTPA
jgi:IS30 family transposase